MSGSILVLNESNYTLDAVRLAAVAETVLQQQSIQGELTIVITDNEEVTALNRQFRGIDSPTDVLSFPADKPPIDVGDEAEYLGDLVIAYPYAAAQAARENHDLMQSLALLVVHGTLHLLGYDHDNQTRRAQMWAAQDRALIALNIPTGIVPALEGNQDADE